MPASWLVAGAFKVKSSNIPGNHNVFKRVSCEFPSHHEKHGAGKIRKEWRACSQPQQTAWKMNSNIDDEFATILTLSVGSCHLRLLS